MPLKFARGKGLSHLNYMWILFICFFLYPSALNNQKSGIVEETKQRNIVLLIVNWFSSAAKKVDRKYFVERKSRAVPNTKLILNV